MRLSPPDCAVVSLSDTVYNHLRDALLWHCSSEGSLLEVLLVQSPAYWVWSSTPLVPSLVFWVQLRSSMRCFLEVPPIQSPAYGVWSTIIQGMRFLYTFCAVISFSGMRLLVERWYIYWSTGLDLQSSTRCLFLHCWCNYRFIGLGLQSSRGSVYYGIVNACYWSIGLGLQLFMGCVYFCAAGTPINLLALDYNHPGDASITALSMHVTGLLVLVYNCPWDAPISVLLVYLLIYWFWSTIIQKMRLLRYCQCMLLVYWFWSTIIFGIRLFLHCWYIYRFIGLGL